MRETTGSGETRAALAAKLLTTAHTALAARGQDTPPEHHVLLPADRRDHPEAVADLAFYRDSMQGERSWWRTAETLEGETVGFALPSRNTTSHVVGYLGVLPQHRGHDYVDDLLAETTRLLSEEAGAGLVRADTDLPNRPMVVAFERLGYRDSARRLVLSAP